MKKTNSALVVSLSLCDDRGVSAFSEDDDNEKNDCFARHCDFHILLLKKGDERALTKQLFQGSRMCPNISVVSVNVRCRWIDIDVCLLVSAEHLQCRSDCVYTRMRTVAQLKDRRGTIHRAGS